MAGSPFSDPPLGDGELMRRRLEPLGQERRARTRTGERTLEATVNSGERSSREA